MSLVKSTGRQAGKMLAAAQGMGDMVTESIMKREKRGRGILYGAEWSVIVTVRRVKTASLKSKKRQS